MLPLDHDQSVGFGEYFQVDELRFRPEIRSKGKEITDAIAVIKRKPKGIGTIVHGREKKLRAAGGLAEGQ